MPKIRSLRGEKEKIFLLSDKIVLLPYKESAHSITFHLVVTLISEIKMSSLIFKNAYSRFIFKELFFSLLFSFNSCSLLRVAISNDVLHCHVNYAWLHSNIISTFIWLSHSSRLYGSMTGNHACFTTNIHFARLLSFMLQNCSYDLN